LSLSASATELRFGGNARTAYTLQPTLVNVQQDIDAPTINFRVPGSDGSSVVENRSLSYNAEIIDNVAVSVATVRLFADRDLDGNFSADEELYQRVMLAPPYAGSIPLSSMAAIMSENFDPLLGQLPLSLQLSANDGAGNQSVATRSVNLLKNSLPEVTSIQFLDAEGYNLGNVSEVTEGREIVVNVLATDAEAGIDSITLYSAQGGSGAVEDFVRQGTDFSAPFQFDIQVPVNQVGETLRFAAEATDVDGYVSNRSFVVQLTIKADQPPEVEIVQPSNDASAVVDGEDIEILASAIDDLGKGGIEKVVFYINGVPSYTAFSSYQDIEGGVALDHIYRALLTPPQGVDGFAIQAEAIDILGHSSRSQVVHIGRVEGTAATGRRGDRDGKPGAAHCRRNHRHRQRARSHRAQPNPARIPGRRRQLDRAGGEYHQPAARRCARDGRFDPG
jgi:hypothetical protein